MLIDALLSACHYGPRRRAEDLLAGLIHNRHQLGELGDELIRLLWEGGIRPTPSPGARPWAAPSGWSPRPFDG